MPIVTYREASARLSRAVWGSVIAASVAFAVGGAFMKVSVGFTRVWPTVAVIALFVVGAFLLSRAIRMGGLSTAYTLGLGVEAIVSVAIGTYLFEERLSPVKLLGVVLILAGVTGVRFG